MYIYIYVCIYIYIYIRTYLIVFVLLLFYPLVYIVLYRDTYIYIYLLCFHTCLYLLYSLSFGFVEASSSGSASLGTACPEGVSPSSRDEANPNEGGSCYSG